MNRSEKEKFDDLTDRLLAEQAGFAHAVSRIVAPARPAKSTPQNAKRLKQEIDSSRAVSPIEAFCAAAG
ncbi:hypothetical protein GO298_02834 [Ralstonia solanacearum]|nr:hypothetical protein [Ralstonia solanacearum]